VYNEFVKVAREAKSMGYKKWSISGTLEVIRWERRITINGDHEFKIANDHATYYARLFQMAEPDFYGFFQTKTADADHELGLDCIQGAQEGDRGCSWRLFYQINWAISPHLVLALWRMFNHITEDTGMRRKWDNTIALQEGWDLFQVYREGGSFLEIQRLDDPAGFELEYDDFELDYDDPKFECDEDAVKFVTDKATNGSVYHFYALSLHGTEAN